MTLLNVAMTRLDTLVPATVYKVGTFLADPPDVKSKTPPFAGQLMQVAGWLMWVATLACVVGVIITAIRIALAFRGGGDANIAQLAWVLFACILVGGATGIARAFI